MSQAWKDYQQKNKVRFLNELLELLRIPSISARSENKPDMQKCAEAVKQRLLEAGADKAEVFQTQGHPIVYGEKIIDPKKPTVLVYGHYDVQPGQYGLGAGCGPEGLATGIKRRCGRRSRPAAP